jgi:cation diffusion facilitator CzcD-associated flavoprotein CzcO
LIIIGAGFSGIGLGMRLLAAGRNDFVILEQAEQVGGTWWVNRYPGCACDVQSHLYSLSFAPNPNWSRHFASRAEIQAYLVDCVSRSGLETHIRSSTRVIEARWDDHEGHWQVRDQRGTIHRGEILVPAIGGLSRPAWPRIEGLNRFKGPVIHSQQWPDHLDLSGQRVAVIGTGASAIQFVPEIQPKVARLDLYQRTPPWILPKPDRPITPGRRALYRRFPPLRLLFRFGLYLLLESRLPAFTRFPGLSWFHRRKAIRFLHRQISDPKLRASLTPDHAMGCKRVLMSNNYFPALAQSNVELITSPATAIAPGGVIDAQGQERTTNTIILATGFRATEPVPEGMIIGRDQQDLATLWQDGPTAYKGTTIRGFPNLFMLLGPNTALGHNSVLLMIEAQINYLVDALAYRERSGQRILEVSEKAQQLWNRKLHERLERTVWNQGGCASWYLHPRSGRNTTLWPRSTLVYRWLTRCFDPRAYS